MSWTKSKMQLHFEQIACHCHLQKFIDGPTPILFIAYDLSLWTLICVFQQDRATLQIIR